MKQWQDMVAEFHRKHGAPIGSEPGRISARRAYLRCELHDEECRELRRSILLDGAPPIAKELADLIYVALGTALEHGIDMDHAFRAVHESNMTKTPGDQRSDGKITKGDDYQPPDMARIAQPYRG